MKKINLHITHENFEYSSRILRQTEAVSEIGYFDHCYVVALADFGHEPIEIIDSSRTCIRVSIYLRKLVIKKYLKLFILLEWYFKIFFNFFSLKVSIVNCHGIASLPVGVFLKFIKSSYLIYDTHELETEQTNLKGFWKFAAKISERVLIRFVDDIIVASDGIAEWYEQKYNIKNIQVIRNIPQKYKIQDSVQEKSLKEQYRIPKDEMLYIYQGNLEMGRGIELILDAFSRLSKSCHIIFMGVGTLLEKILEKEKQYSNIHYKAPVPPKSIFEVTQGADIGIALIENVSLSYYYCLPNKFFEYCLSGLPVIVSNLPEMAKLVNCYNCGWIANQSSDSLYSLVSSITYADIGNKLKGVQHMNKEVNWSNEKVKLKEIYIKAFQRL